jgi:MFS family permease
MGKRKRKIWTKDFLIVFLTNVFSMTGFQMLNPIMAEYASVLGAGTGILGSVTAVFSLAALAARPFSGKAADRLDNKKAIIASQAGIALSLFLYSLTRTVATMLAVRFIHGVFFGLSSTLAMALASRTLPEERMGSGMSVFGLGTVLASTAAPTIGIYIVEYLDFEWLFYIASMSGAMSTVLAFFLSGGQKYRAEGGGPKAAFWKTFFAPEALSPATLAFLQSAAYGSVNTFLLLHAKELGVGDIGLYFTVSAITLVVSRPFFARYLDRVPVKFIIYPGSVLMMVSMVLIGISRSLPGFIIAAVLFGIGNGGASPAIQALCLKSVEYERRGAASGTFYMGLDVGNTFGPMACGMLADAFGYGVAFMSLSVPIILSMLVLFISERYKKTCTDDIPE